MPRKTDGKSLKQFYAKVWYAGRNEDVKGQEVELTIMASNLQGAVGRAAREARKQLKGRFVEATVNIIMIGKDAKDEAIDQGAPEAHQEG